MGCSISYGFAYSLIGSVNHQGVGDAMPLDHYVSQVHLKNFYSPKLEGLLYAIRKSDLKQFTPNAKSVCRVEGGSTNPYMQEERAIEEFLKVIEPNYNAAVEKLVADKIDQECIYVIAGFIAYILTCSPAGMRISSVPIKGALEEAGRIIESQGLLPPPPKELGGATLAELLDREKIHIKIDPKYPQAIGINSILSFTSAFGNFKWDILINPFDDNPFFTSDFPIAIEKSDDPRIINKIVPLAPNIAIRIIPDISLNRDNTDFSFSRFGSATRQLNRQEVISINRLIVRCAEETLFFRDNYEWIPRFVERNASFRIETRTHRIPNGKGTLLATRWEIRQT